MYKRLSCILLTLVLIFSACGGCGEKPPPKANHYTLEFTVEGSGTVTLDPDLSLYEAGSSVEIGASTVAELWSFDRFEGDLAGSNPSQVILMDSHKTFKAIFVERVIPPTRHTVAVEVVGQGHVNLDPSQPFAGYLEATTVTATAVGTVARWDFVNFTLDGVLLPIDSPFIFNVDSNMTIAAFFIFNTPPDPQIINMPEWIVTTSNDHLQIGGSDFTITEDGLYDLSALLEYSGENSNPPQDKEHVYFRVDNGNSEIKPLVGNHDSGDFIVLDLNDNELEKFITRDAGRFQLGKGEYKLNVYHGSTLLSGDFRGAQSVHGNKFTLWWRQPDTQPPARARIER